MASITFVLKEPKSKKETLIYLYLRFNNDRVRYTFNEKILPEYWNFKLRRVKETRKFPQYPEFNSRLNYIEDTAKTIFRKLLNDGITITPEVLANELDKELRFIKSTKIGLIEFINKYIVESEGLKSVGTIKTYKRTLNNLINFSQRRKIDLEFENINLEFYSNYISYLTNDLKYAVNTIGGYIKNLKVFLNEATERGLNTNMEFQKKKFKKLTQETDKVYLSESELAKIYEMDLSENVRLEKVRDLFIVGCYTGLRFSDFIQIKPENIIDNNKIKIRTQKTAEFSIIPLSKYVREILVKYDNLLPRSISNQKMNEYIKEICLLADIKNKVEMSVTKGGKLKKATLEKYKLISSHTARRSFATNLYLADVPSISIMKITGHKSELAFLTYIRVTQEQNANKLIEHKFFN